MADAKLPALTETSALAVADVIYTVDVSDTTDDATGSSRKISLTRLGAFINHGICQGRLTLESGVPVSTSDQTSKTSVYFTPYNGNRISVYDGTRWNFYSFSELTLALGTITSGKQYDIFIYDNSGTLTLELSAAWTNDTTRADALALQDGIYCKSGALTRRHLGTIRTTSTTTTEDSGGGSTTQVGGKRFCWNRYNQVRRSLSVIDTTDSWTCSSTTYRQANGASGNKVEFINGDVVDVACDVILSCYMSNNGPKIQVAVGVDSTTVASGLHGEGLGNAITLSLSGSYRGFLAAGYHYLAWLEAVSSGSETPIGDNTGSSQSGLSANLLG